LLIIGEGSERKKIENEIENLNLSKYVHITGFQNDVRRFIEITDICCLSSATETFSIAILEAMSLHKPIIGPRVGGVTEQVIDNINGLTFPVGDIDALFKTLETMITSNRIEQMGQASRQRVEQLFTLKQMVSDYRKLCCLP
jgi:glycosyltransferase involved in cell wall biosynthesis